MQYMLIFFETDSEFAKRQSPDAEAYWGGWMAYVNRIQASGLVVSGAGLQAPSTATTVRERDGRRVVHDGPFADTKEQLAGYFVIDARLGRPGAVRGNLRRGGASRTAAISRLNGS